jgi:hypothetical protein
LEAEVSWKAYLGAALVVTVAGCLCLVSPRLGGLALIVVALGGVAAVAYRLL